MTVHTGYCDIFLYEDIVYSVFWPFNLLLDSDREDVHETKREKRHRANGPEPDVNLGHLVSDALYCMRQSKTWGQIY